MDRTRGLVAAAVALCLLDRVEYRPAFTSPAGSPASAALRGAASAEDRRAGAVPPSAPAGNGLPTATAVLALGAAGLAARRRAAPQQAGTRKRVQLCADASGLTPGGPVVAYTQALMDAAEKKGESVPVTKDVMMIRNKFDDEDFLDELLLVVNEPGQTVVEVAKATSKLLAPFESTVMEKFITFLAKKKRLMALKPICKEYVASLYFNQSVAPVVVRSAQKLTDEQIKKIKEKMKAKTGTEEVKLVNEVDGSLLAGLVVEWGYTDPENLAAPSEGIDISLQTILQKAAINRGVLVSV